MTKEVIGIGYTRVSSRQQVKEGVSLEVQDWEVRRLLEKNGCTKVKIFSDKGKSGRSITGRNEFINAVNYAVEHKAKYFACYDTSRFARNAVDAMSLYKQLHSNDITFLCVTARFEDTPEGKLVFGMMASIDEYQSNKQGARIKESNRQKRENGYLPGSAPAGYKNIRREDGRADIIIDPVKGPLVEHVLREYAYGKASTQKELAIWLNNNGFRNKQGNPIHTQFISKILHNRFYSGYFYDKFREVWQKHVYETLISEEEHAIIFNRLAKRNTNKPNIYHQQHEDFPLRTCIYCAYCGSKVRGYSCNGNGGKYYYYDCPTKGCNHAVQTKYIHEQFNVLLQHLKLDQGQTRLLKEILRRELSNASQHRHLEIKRLNASFNRLRTEENAIIENIAKISNATVISRLEHKLENIAIQLRSIEDKLKQDTGADNIEPLVEKGMKLLSNIDLLWIKSDIQTKTEIQEWLFPVGLRFNYKTELRTPQLPFVYEVINNVENNNSSLVEAAGIEPASNNSTC